MSEATQPVRDPLAVLTASAAALARASDLDEALSALLAVGIDATGARAAAVFLQDPDRPELQLGASVGIAPDDAARFAASVADGAADHPIARVAAGQSIGGADAGDGSIHLPLAITTSGIQIILGVLVAHAPEGGAFDETDRAVLGSIADLLAVGVDRARMAATASERSDWFERMAHTDPLTGLANERTVGRILELELARAGRQDSEVSIVMFDIDDFQATNRDGGHQAGDDVLRRVAAVLAESVRLVDTVGRIGGDEFVLVAPGSAGLTVARRVLDGIVALPAVAGRPVSVSAGVARFPTDGTDAQSLIEAATAALTQARADGRGQAALSPTPAES